MGPPPRRGSRRGTRRRGGRLRSRKLVLPGHATVSAMHDCAGVADGPDVANVGAGDRVQVVALRTGVLPHPATLSGGCDGSAAEQGTVQGQRGARGERLVERLVLIGAGRIVEAHVTDARVADRDACDVVVTGGVARRRAVDGAPLAGDGHGDTRHDGAAGRERRAFDSPGSLAASALCTLTSVPGLQPCGSAAARLVLPS